MARDADIRSQVQSYVDELLSLYESTDPAKGRVTEDDKLEAARRAISLWWRLYGILMVWAQSQIVGYCYARDEPKVLVALSSEKNTEITEDSHELEYLGLQYVANPGDTDCFESYSIQGVEDEDQLPGLSDSTLRSIICELLVSTSANSSFWRFDLQGALYALNHGEVRDLVKPIPGRRKGLPYQLLIWKHRAIQHVWYRVGKGMKKYRALEVVATAIGQSTETLRSWEKEVARDEDLSFDLHVARVAGELEDELASKSISQIEKERGATYHRNQSDVYLARYHLGVLQRCTLEKVRDQIRRSRLGEPEEVGES
jgi:hypothetical protein